MEGEEELTVRAVRWPEVPGALPRPEPFTGVRCTMSNDKGSWAAMTPGVVRVQRSHSPLQVECVADGYKPAHATLVCRSPDEGQVKSAQAGLAWAVVALPLAVIAAPMAPHLLVQLAAHGATAAATPRGASEATPGCTYGPIAPAMSR